MARIFNSKTVAAVAAAAPSHAITSISAKSTFRTDWTNKGSNKGFYTFTSDRTPGGYIG